MPGPRFRTDNSKQVFNEFGKPIMRTAAETGLKCLCCEKCEQYLQCFKKVPIGVDFKGLDFSDWMEWNQWVWDVPTNRTRTGDFTGDDPDGSSEFIGKYVFLPNDPRLECNGQPCFHDGVLEEGEPERRRHVLPRRDNWRIHRREVRSGPDDRSGDGPVGLG